MTRLLFFWKLSNAIFSLYITVIAAKNLSSSEWHSFMIKLSRVLLVSALLKA